MTRNSASNVLLYGGAALIVIGVIAAAALKQKADHDNTVARYVRTLEGLPANVEPNYSGVVIAAIIAVIGAVMVIAYLAARAARPAES